MKSRFILPMLFLLLLLALAGCGKTGGKEAAGKEVFPPDEQGYVVIDGEEKKLEKGNYYWEVKKGLTTEVTQTDAASPNQIAENVEAISAPPDTEMSFKLVGDPTITAYLRNGQDREKEIELQEEKFRTPTEKGRYIYEVLAEWENGEISYTYVIELE
jgi:predicted small lipoprotein YifL